jgi:uncharacterized protein YndB with AHSA1/START domain
MSDTRQVSVSRVIPAPPEALFAIVADANRHADFDGSGSVKAAVGDPEPLVLGSKFGMNMRIGLPYRIQNEVVEYEKDRLIAWQHFGRHRWRYEFEPVDGGTKVTETFDWSTSRSPLFIELMGYPKKHPANMDKTLERLEAVATGG